MKNIPGLRLLAALTVISNHLAGLAQGAELHTRNPHQIILNDLCVLPEYIHWPTNTARPLDQPWRIGILGTDPFGEQVEKNVSGHDSANRKIEIWHAAGLSNLPPCDIIFIAGKDAGEIKKILKQLGSRPVLTASEHENFLTLGGMIQFQTRDTVRILIDLDHARAANLHISARMLEVVSEVVEKGGRQILKK